MESVKNIIFDLGVVLIDILNEENWWNNYMMPLIGKELQLVQDECHEFELGLLSKHEFHEALKRKSGKKFALNELEQAWNGRLLEIPAKRIEMLRQLKSGYSLYLLSNTNQVHIEMIWYQLRQQYGKVVFDDIFLECFYSNKMHVVKPDQKIYEIVHHEMGNPQKDECLFFDDNLANIQAAKDFGWKAIEVEWEIIDLVSDLKLV